MQIITDKYYHRTRLPSLGNYSPLPLIFKTKYDQEYRGRILYQIERYPIDNRTISYTYKLTVFILLYLNLQLINRMERSQMVFFLR